MTGRNDDRGESLIESILAIAIMGTTLVAIIGGLATSILMSDIHRKQATAGALVREYAEAVETYVVAGNYVDCATPTSSPKNYSPAKVGFILTTGYTATVTAASSWTGSAWVTCSADIGYQKIALRVGSNDTRASETLDVILRKPCGTGSICTA
jgi:hypothetical protein